MPWDAASAVEAGCVFLRSMRIYNTAPINGRVATTANQIALALVLENRRFGMSRIAQNVGISGTASTNITSKILNGIRCAFFGSLFPFCGFGDVENGDFDEAGRLIHNRFILINGQTIFINVRARRRKDFFGVSHAAAAGCRPVRDGGQRLFDCTVRIY